MDNREQVALAPASSDRGKKKAANVFVDLESSSSSEAPARDEADDDDNDDDDDDDGDLDDMETTLRQNALLLSDDEEDDEEGGEGDQAQDRWGKNKYTFYQEREEDSSSSDERLHEEEAARIQAKKLAQMKDADFMELPDDEKTEKKKSSKAKSSKKDKKKKRSSGEDEVEQEIVGGQERKGKDKELAALVAELNAKSAELRDVVQPLLQKAQSGEIETSSGISYMELKNMLLLNYCLNLNFYLLLKAEGKAVRDHPVIEELVRLRLLIEKTKPIDEKLRPQVNRLLKTAALGIDSVMNDPAMLRANPGQMLLAAGGNKKASKKPREHAEDDEEDDNDGDGMAQAGGEEVYRAPRATSMFFDKEESKGAKRERREQRVKERAAKSSIMKMVQEEFADGPEEYGTGLGVMDVPDEERETQREIAEFEQDNFMRLRPTKAQKKSSKREFVDELKSLDDFGDMERALKTARFQGQQVRGEGAAVAEGPLSKMAKKLQQTQDRELAVDPRTAPRDSRVVSKRDLEAEKAYDAFLEESKKKRDVERKKKYDANPNARRRAVEVEVNNDASGKRHISQQMEVNKGLSVQRKKDIARVKNKKKYANADKKRAGMTRKVRKETQKYDGESAGINSNVIRSTKL